MPTTYTQRTSPTTTYTGRVSIVTTYNGRLQGSFLLDLNGNNICDVNGNPLIVLDPQGDIPLYTTTYTERTAV